MKFIGQCLVNFLDHINVPNFYLSSLDGNTTTLKKSINLCVLFFKLIKFQPKDSIFFKNYIILKKN